MNSVLADLVVQLNRHGYDSAFNPKYGTIDIVGVHGRPLLDPWPLQVTTEGLAQVVDLLKNREGVGASDAIELLASMIEQDVAMYSPTDGPFLLDEHGYVVRANAAQ